MAPQSRFRACPLGEAICGLELQYQGDALVAIRGDAQDPFGRGHICPKGNALLDLEADPDRLRQPMQRIGEQWQPIAWDDAFALAGERLAEIAGAHGAAAIGAYLGKRSEEQPSELQSLMCISYALFCLKKKKCKRENNHYQ